MVRILITLLGLSALALARTSRHAVPESAHGVGRHAAKGCASPHVMEPLVTGQKHLGRPDHSVHASKMSYDEIMEEMMDLPGRSAQILSISTSMSFANVPMAMPVLVDRLRSLSEDMQDSCQKIDGSDKVENEEQGSHMLDIYVTTTGLAVRLARDLQPKSYFIRRMGTFAGQLVKGLDSYARALGELGDTLRDINPDNADTIKNVFANANVEFQQVARLLHPGSQD